MTTLSSPILRHLSRHAIRSPRLSHPQRRWAQVHDVRLLVTQPPQAIIDKYRSRLEDKARNEGLSSVEDLKTAYAGKIKELHTQQIAEFPTIPQAPNTPISQPNKDPPPSTTDSQPGEQRQKPDLDNIPQAGDTPVKQPNAGKQPPFTDSQSTTTTKSGGKQAIKGLDDIIDLSKARLLPEKELTAIWRLRHANNPNNVCAVVPSAAYRAMEDAARSAPQFILPVPHESQGAEMHFLQWVFDSASRTSTVLFTQLAEFKVRGEFAQPHTTITHHLDLLEEKGLVLMQGHIMEDRGVSTEQAKWLIMCLQRFYGGWEGQETELTGERKARAEERKNLLSWFASGDERFTVEKLMEEAERMG